MLNNNQQLMALTFLSKVSKSVLKPGEYEKKKINKSINVCHLIKTKTFIAESGE